MREFVFTVEYERGVDEVMDLFIENPDLHSKTMAIHATSESMWRLDRLTGPTEALEAFDEVIEQATRCNGVLGMCGAPVVEWDYEVLSETPNGRIVYSCREEGDGIQSIPHVAAKHIGDGLLMQAERRGAQNQWRLLISDDDTVSEIYEEVKDSLSDGLSLSVQRISEPECWLEEGVSADGLPPEQQAALEAAVSDSGGTMYSPNDAAEIAASARDNAAGVQPVRDDWTVAFVAAAFLLYLTEVLARRLQVYRGRTQSEGGLI